MAYEVDQYRIKDYLFDFICSEVGIKIHPVTVYDGDYDVNWGDQTLTRLSERILRKEIRYICVPAWTVK